MKKKILTYIGAGAIVALVAIQFIPMTRNNGNINGANDITQVVEVSDEIAAILNTSCMDCHSNHTNYPWYSKIQPVGFWLNHHVDEGIRELNFSEFATYTKKRQLHKLEETIEMLEKKEMPLGSYTLVHKEAKLSDTQTMALITWARDSRNTIAAQP